MQRLGGATVGPLGACLAVGNFNINLLELVSSYAGQLRCRAEVVMHGPGQSRSTLARPAAAHRPGLPCAVSMQLALISRSRAIALPGIFRVL